MIEYAGFRAVCQWRECAAGVAATGMGGLEFHGTKGTLVLGRDGFEIFPDKKPEPDEHRRSYHWRSSSRWTSTCGPSRTANLDRACEGHVGDWKDQYVQHTRNFIDCVKSRKEPKL